MFKLSINGANKGLYICVISIIFYVISLLILLNLNYSMLAIVISAALVFVSHICSGRILFDSLDSALLSFKKNIATVSAYILSSAYLLITLLKSYININTAPNYFHTCIILCFLLLFGLVFFLYSFLLDRSKFENLFFIQSIIFGMVFLFIFPLYTVADEPKHMRTAYDLSNTFLNIPRSDKGIYMRKDDAEFDMKYIDYSLDDVEQYFREMAAPLQNSELILVEDTEPYSYTIEYTRRPTVIKGQSYQYLPQAIGITLGRLLGLNSVSIYLLGRAFNLLFYSLIIYVSIKVLPFGKILLYSIALLPMPLHLAASTSRDVLRITSIILIVSLLLYLMYSDPAPKQRIVSVITLLITCLLALPLRRYACILFCLLPLAVYCIRKNWISKKAVNIFAVTTAVLAFAYIIIKSFIYKQPIVEEHELKLVRNGFSGFTIQYFINNPFVLIQLIKNSIIEDGFWYITSMIGNSLGWLDVSFPDLFVFILLIVLTVNTIPRDYEKQALSSYFRFYLFLISVITILLSLIGMAATYTTFGYNVIQGFQGRYLLPALFPLLLTLGGPNILAKEKTNNITIGIQLLTTILILHVLILRLLQ